MVIGMVFYLSIFAGAVINRLIDQYLSGLFYNLAAVPDKIKLLSHAKADDLVRRRDLVEVAAQRDFSAIR